MQAFAPGSVTALFAPAGAGESMGASFAVEDGVVADVTPAEERPAEERPADERPADDSVVLVEGDPTDFEPVELALADLGVSARVDLAPEVPIGCGFGASGAATLATALAANEEFDLERSREELVGVAHCAEVEAGTGLGDVFVQEMGGLVVGDGENRWRFERDTPVEYARFGGIATEGMLADDDLMARIERAGVAALDALPEDPEMADVTREGWRFADETGLPTPEVRETVARAEDAGGVASMAMVGETVFAVGVEGELPDRTRVCADGAGLC
ncbi:GHMP kinase [Halorussus salilacus]|uniref:GHMP family kinase ATP-binding protein n=1 Tax=Halorussus salilacus TaxID=2953750 RepID=UPI00209CA99F|nr:GHMP kinase [Halorussus salilacus]USZ68954.1 GHMP kinase [Halorussus salilacus]